MGITLSGGLNISGGMSVSPPPPPSGPGGSIDFGGNSYFQYASQSQFQFGTGDFTVELWLKITGGDGIHMIINGNYPGYMQLLEPNSNGTTYARLSSFYGGISSVVPYNTWKYFTFARKSGVSSIYVNGIALQTFADTTDYSGNNPFFGDNYYNNGCAQRMTNIRIVKGTALYNGSNFTPPTAPLTKVSGTVLLLDAMTSATYLTDSSTNGFTPALTHGTLTWNADTPY